LNCLDKLWRLFLSEANVPKKKAAALKAALNIVEMLLSDYISKRIAQAARGTFPAPGPKFGASVPTLS
jgi:hypothetical protein